MSGKRIVRPKEAQARLGIGHDKFWRDVKNGTLPPLVRLGPKSVGHVEEELDAYIEGLMKQRGAAPRAA
jgi:predicted DNA-binding transcriptional regulator AlpA